MEKIESFLSNIDLIKIRNVFLTIVIGYIILQAVLLLIRKVLAKRLSLQWKMLLNKGIVYAGIIIILLMVLETMGVSLKALLGAAGIAGVVIGFASQTSVGNIISGLFLVTEKPFEIGDLIKVGDKMGSVYSIDLLSVKLKTLDNLLIRIPNQTLISTEITNVTRFPIRRMDIVVGVAYKEDLKRVMEILKQLAVENVNVLNEPEPLILLKDFGESSIDILYGLWFEKSNYLVVRNSMIQAIKETFDREGIEIPFPHRTIYTGEVTKPYPVVVKDDK
ncbi:MAG: mechanosensitive ion channel family protein [Bacteroidales bacterium]|nr:mechanosensitive ion channel family protein [Bacteroidales bacterium]MBN2821199.1 mechanosensitive ion channel family protein [Bacteroidales bacterium]